MPWNTLISADTLRARLNAPDWRVVDCRYELTDPAAGRRQWQLGHIPGAVFADLGADLSGPVTAETGRHPLPDVDAFVAWLGRHGIDNDTQVVAYDAGPGVFAARLWWLLRWIGHESVAVLDGGLAAWQANDGPTDDDAPTTRATTFRGHPDCLPRVDTGTLETSARDYLLVDARTAERYRGDSEPLDPVAGHIPGSLNRPFQDNLDDQGRFKTPEALREEWRPLLARAGSRLVVATCGSGVSACHHVLALAHAGVSGVGLYPGSWSEWCRDPARGVERGAGDA